MKKLALSLSLLAIGSLAALAGPVEDREAIMKERAGLLRQLSPYAKGEQEFDAAKVQGLLEALKANAEKKSAAELFPEGSGEGTEASPKIWEDWAGFQAAWDRYDAVVAAAVAANPQDAGALGQHVGLVGAQCGACHQAYRVSR
jgi:cytochrome c556